MIMCLVSRLQFGKANKIATGLLPHSQSFNIKNDIKNYMKNYIKTGIPMIAGIPKFYSACAAAPAEAFVEVMPKSHPACAAAPAEAPVDFKLNANYLVIGATRDCLVLV